MTQINKELLDEFIENALNEDVGSGDYTSLACVASTQRSKAKLLVKDVGIIAGIGFAEKVFIKLDPTANFVTHFSDGSDVNMGDIAFEVECNTQALLKAERLILNTMQRMSGIATMSGRFAIEVEGMDVDILDTRKTTPLLRFLEKWAVRIGGCKNYRDGLYDRIMIKDNHIAACGGVEESILRVHQYLKENHLDLGITIEVKNLVELYEVMRVGKIDRIMLDNFELPILAEAVAIVGDKFETEASGGVRLKNVRKIAKTGINFISVGALTHSAGCLDLSLKITE